MQEKDGELGAGQRNLFAFLLRAEVAGEREVVRKGNMIKSVSAAAAWENETG